MVNITKENVIRRIYLDYGESSFVVPGYLFMVRTTLYKLLEVKEEDAESKLSQDISKVSKNFVDQLRKRWNKPKVQGHLDRFEKENGPWLKTNFLIPYYDEVPKASASAQTESESETEPEQQGPIFQPDPPKPPSPKKQKPSFDSFLDKVRIYFFASAICDTPKFEIIGFFLIFSLIPLVNAMPKRLGTANMSQVHL